MAPLDESRRCILMLHGPVSKAKAAGLQHLTHLLHDRTHLPQNRGDLMNKFVSSAGVDVAMAGSGEDDALHC